MSVDAIFAVTRHGLDFERARMEAASQRIALSDVPLAQKVAAASASGFAGALGPKEAIGASTAAEGDAAHVVLDPSNPAADENGTVHMPDVDLAQEMTTLMSAERAYQADIRSFNTLHGMLMKSLEIGR